MQVTGMSQAFRLQHIIGWVTYDRYRPDGWPTARFLLEVYGFSPDADGWENFVYSRIGQRVMAPNARYKTMQRKERWCKVCGSLRIWRAGRCGTCDSYWKRNHVERPRHLWDDEVKCKVCGVPLNALGLHNGRKRQRRGKCETCASYWRKYRRERPRYLWGIGPAGWCDCGYPAIAVVDGNIPVCARHAE